MDIEHFKIEGIDPIPEEGFCRGHVVLTFTDGRFGDDPPVQSKLDVGCFIPHDAASSLEKVETEFLREAHRLLSAAVKAVEGQDAQAIRRQASASRQAKADRLQAAHDGKLDQ